MENIHAGEGNGHGFHCEWAKDTDVKNLEKDKKKVIQKINCTLILCTTANNNIERESG